MYLHLAAVSPFYAFQQSDLVGRIIVLILFLASVFAWTIIAEKWLYLRAVRRQVIASMKFFRESTGPLEVLSHIDSLRGPMHRIADALRDGLAAGRRQTPALLLAELRSKRKLSALNSAETDRLRALAESAVDNEILRMEARLGLLGSIVGASPFLGLLGTVWGVMMAFTGMAMVGRADIGAIAPGVSGALLTTVVGLLVAIPALIGYNLLVNNVKLLSIKMDNFAAEFISWLQSENSLEE